MINSLYLFCQAVWFLNYKIIICWFMKMIHANWYTGYLTLYEHCDNSFSGKTSIFLIIIVFFRMCCPNRCIYAITEIRIEEFLTIWNILKFKNIFLEFLNPDNLNFTSGTVIVHIIYCIETEYNLTWYSNSRVQLEGHRLKSLKIRSFSIFWWSRQ